VSNNGTPPTNSRTDVLLVFLERLAIWFDHVSVSGRCGEVPNQLFQPLVS
jgi:hypothetical protein